MNAVKIEFVLNGKTTKASVKPNTTLLDLLHNLRLTGTKKGCDRGDCGACTIQLDGRAVNACLVLAPQVAGKEVTTIEGIGTPDKLHPLQQTFVDFDAVQCGYCIPGLIMSAKSLLDENSNPTTEEIRNYVSGNLCRCTGYLHQIEAIKAAAKLKQHPNSTKPLEGVL
jgi:carbon-monoxide dehydrogenase small subunit